MIKIYTDGSCLGNPGNGGWAAIIIENGKKTHIKGGQKATTNNQMELLAPIKALKKIPKGSVKTYKEIACILGKPNSFRAVANACAKNPLIIEIPCHRVIRSDGLLGGYSGKGGIQKKRQLLIEEGFNKFKYD